MSNKTVFEGLPHTENSLWRRSPSASRSTDDASGHLARTHSHAVSGRHASARIRYSIARRRSEVRHCDRAGNVERRLRADGEAVYPRSDLLVARQLADTEVGDERDGGGAQPTRTGRHRARSADRSAQGAGSGSPRTRPPNLPRLNWSPVARWRWLPTSCPSSASPGAPARPWRSR